MSLFQNIVNWIAGRFKIPAAAMQMFRISNEISGIDKDTPPTELIPLNSIQLSRGLLNFTILQSLSNWVLPYWAEKQYDPQSPSFIPRSHLGLSINVTHRNWTAVGSPDCSVEPIVDPAGMVTPFINSWSIDTWLKVDGEIFFPSRAAEISQKLVDNLPVVETKFNFKDIELALTTFTENKILIHQVEISNSSNHKTECEVILAVRPFNPEGIAIIENTGYDEKENSIIINKDKRFFLSQRPDYIYCSSLQEGDSAALLSKNREYGKQYSSFCKSGLSTMSAVFKANLEPGTKYLVEAFCNLENPETKKFVRSDYKDTISFWKELVNEGAIINTPDEFINSIYTASVASLLLLKDKNIITPGPFIYHQFWFRDAAYMLWALDKSGYSRYTSEIISSYPAYQLKDGYFRSQKGEWDSNGQAIWSVYQHASLSNNYEILNKLFDSLQKGIKWIDKTRMTSAENKDKPYYGLMPAGLSAEHLGLADFYFWDNMWSIAGIEAFIEICKLLNKKDKEEGAVKLLITYKKHLLQAIESVQKKYDIKEIPASPTRNVDCGMIGSICGSYPLKVLPPAGGQVTASLDTLMQYYFVKGMFYQNFVHSGLNIYLSLQAAHAYLYAGNRSKFWEIFSNVIKSATPTLNFPEAVHPSTGGGCMGDGHHGWASAEIVLALHEAFVFEAKNEDTGEYSLNFLHGIPINWFIQKNSFSIKKSHTSAGIISIECKSVNGNYVVNINFSPFERRNKFRWIIKLPFKVDNACQDQLPLNVENINEESVIEIKPGNTSISFQPIYPL